MENIETTIQEINGSIYIRVPAVMAQYFKLKGKTKAKISELSSNEVKIKFPVW